jgi:hypothetical protein
MDIEVRDAVFEALEHCLDAQLRAVRRLRKAPREPAPPRPKKRRSQVDMAYDILKKARGPLHVSDILARILKTFEVRVDRESLVSALSKKVARGDRFVRTDKNTFAVKEEGP